MKPHEPVVSQSTPMPKGYGFLRKGNPFMTALCRRKTHEARKPLYIVMNNARVEGLRAPKWIIGEVFAEERTTRERRRDAVRRRDVATQGMFETAILKLFPNIPNDDLRTILNQALKKRSGRVGRTGTLQLDQKAHLAVQAHVRHCHTDYDKIMKKTPGRDAARKSVHEDISQILTSWRGDAEAVQFNRSGKTKNGSHSSSLVLSSRLSKRRRPSLQTASAKAQPRRKGGHIRGLNLKQVPNLSAPTQRPKSTPTAGPAVIDLTGDSMDEGDESHPAMDEASAEEYTEAEEADEDDLYELSDMMDSDGDYSNQDSDWLSS